MTSRRSLLAGAAALPLTAIAASAQPAAPSAQALTAAITAKLTEELGDAAVAASLAAVLVEDGLVWNAPRVAADQVTTLVGFAFGNRPNAASGNTPTNGTNQVALPDPGPINELLAEAMFALAQARPEAKIYAQWEIARYLVDKHGLTETVSIEPIIAADGTITYLSTDGVAEAIVATAGSAEALGTVAVFGHRDHSKRCVLTARARGMDAYLPQGIDLPVTYDEMSGQPWTRQRSLYVVHDVLARLTGTRLALIAAAYPNG